MLVSRTGSVVQAEVMVPDKSTENSSKQTRKKAKNMGENTGRQMDLLAGALEVFF